MKKKGTIIKNIEIQAPTSKVWEAFIKPELTKQFFFDCEVQSDFNIGDDITFSLNNIVYVKGKITYCIPEKLLAYSCFSPQTESITDMHTLVTMAFVTEGDTTQLTVTQGSFKDDTERYNQSSEGWDYVLSGLKTLLET